ncbi:hypothetical protein A9K55_005126 [Cordyceps militaris]|uniref:Uncharacterized protein n=1 Tax=Cordyceps militaris TaxID=73501 RepID=A0A2H4SNU6_CORMI|nr:hypothetical protein A9K55_005126 [Cordyceps militaris]
MIFVALIHGPGRGLSAHPPRGPGLPAHNFAWLSSLRWRGECGCSAFAVTDAGCKTFTICTGTHSVCLDWRPNRGHWVDPSGVKRCNSLQNDYTCNRKKWQVWPTAEVDCTW